MDPKMDHLLGVGVMMSRETLYGLPSKWAAAFPPKESVASIFIDHPGVYNVLHYADYDNASDAKDFRKALSYGGPHVNAMQFDMIWPNPCEIAEALGRDNSGPHPIKVILQVGRKAIALYDNNIGRIIEVLKLYRALNCLDYVLLDKSSGGGKEMDSELLLSYHKAIRRHFSREELQIVVAGGLGPESLDRLLAPFRRDDAYLDISIDAQGKLRSSGNSLDPVDWDMAAAYYERAVQYFGWA